MNKDSLRIAAISILILVAGFVFTYQFVEPAPPRIITIASGGPSGAYYAFAQRYHEQLAEHGIQLNVLETAGSIENIDLLKSGQADVAFVQGGTGNAQADPQLVSLGSLYFEPLWVFVNARANVQTLSDLNGLNIAAGAQGSGTWAVVRQLLEINRIPADSPAIAHLSTPDAVRALVDGRVDAAFFVTSATSQVVRDLLMRPELHLLSFERAVAYTRQHPYLSAVTLHRGVISLSDDIPASNVTLLAPAATLAARNDLHPALQTLLVQAAHKIHGGGGVFEQPGQFPSAQFVDYPLSTDAERYLQNGPSFLQRYLPFWAAVLVDRLKVMLIPLLTLLIPLGKILPPAYRWRIRSRIYRWYKDLIRIERAAVDTAKPDERGALLTELTAMEEDLKSLHVPLSYTDEVYNLRLHIEMVKRTLQG